MSAFLWTLQILFSILFLFHGFLLIAQPASRRDQLANLPYSKRFLQFIGVCELLGAVGLILPLWLGIAPVLTPLAAWGLVIILVGAAVNHFRLGEILPAISTSIFALLLVLVAVGRA